MTLKSATNSSIRAEFGDRMSRPAAREINNLPANLTHAEVHSRPEALLTDRDSSQIPNAKAPVQDILVEGAAGDPAHGGDEGPGLAPYRAD
jgi:hypothetical protein